MAVKFRPKYTMQKNVNMSLTNRTFTILGSTELTFKVRFRTECQTILWKVGKELKKLSVTVWNQF